ncbi:MULTISPECIES: hypothetical protein [Methylomonas]|nr:MULTISPECIES: hypothetical protein [Methylomonas]
MSKFILWDLPDAVSFESKAGARIMPGKNRKRRKCGEIQGICGFGTD